jgi:hypothetical protein
MRYVNAYAAGKSAGFNLKPGNYLLTSEHPGPTARMPSGRFLQSGFLATG